MKLIDDTIQKPTSLVTPAELAELLGCTRKHVYNMVKAGIAPPRIMIGRGKYAFAPAAVNAWIEARTISTK